MDNIFDLLELAEKLSIQGEISNLKFKEALLSMETIKELEDLIGSFKYITKKEKKKVIDIINKYKKDISNLINEHEKLANKLCKE